jgi:hypothetical protein
LDLEIIGNGENRVGARRLNLRAGDGDRTRHVHHGDRHQPDALAFEIPATFSITR